MPSMKGLFLLDVEEERRARRARAEADRAADESPSEGAGGDDAVVDPGKPLEDYLARWHGNWRGSSSVK
jgi:hypothetical protein